MNFTCCAGLIVYVSQGFTQLGGRGDSSTFQIKKKKLLELYYVPNGFCWAHTHSGVNSTLAAQVKIQSD